MHSSLGTFNLSGKPVITGNKQGGTFTNGVLTGGTDNNVYLPSGKLITVTGALTTGRDIGVTMEAPGVFTKDWSTKMPNATPTDFFTSDLARFSVRKTSDGSELELYNTPATAPNITALTSLTGDDALIYGYSSGSVSVTAAAATDTAYENLAYQWYTCSSDGTGGAVIDTEQEPTAKTADYTIPTGKNAGTCYYYCVVTAKRSDNGETAEETSGVVTVTVNPKVVGLDWSDTELTYNGAAQKPTATATDLVDGDACNVTVTGEQTNAGGYTATATALDNGNYALPQEATQGFTIDPKVVRLDWSDTSFTYDRQSHAPTATATGLVNEDACNVTVTGEQTNAGTYTAMASKLSNNNYKLPKEVTKGFTIVPKVVGLDWSDTELTYNGAAQKPKTTATGLVKGDSCNVTVTGEQTNAGTYTATASKLSNNNYKLPQKVTQGFTIAKAQQAAPAAPVVKKVTQTSITVKAVSGQEYSRDGGKNWQTSGTFTGLTPDTAYSVRTRLPGDANHEASAPSEASAARTKSQKKAVRHLGVRVTQTGSKLTVKWSKHTDVDTFEVHAAYCGKHFGKIPTVKVKTKKEKGGFVTITKLSGKVLKSRRNFRVRVVGKKDGKVVYKSAACHIVGSRNRWKTNAKNITKLPKTVTLKLSDKNRKTRQLRPKTVLQHPKRKQLGDDHAPEFRYASSNERVAKVNKNGKIIAKGEGECSIYVIARNGLQRRVTVTVKK